MDILTEIRDNPVKWRLMFELLSSDITKSLYQEIGLKIADKENFVKQIRESLLAYPKPVEADQLIEIPDNTFAEMTLDRIGKHLGKEVALCLCQWGTGVFKYALVEKATYGYWIALLLHCKWDDNLWNALGLPQDKNAIFKQKFLNTQDGEQFSLSYEEANKEPLSDWDLQMLNDSVNEEDDYNFLDTLELVLGAAAAIIRNQHFWRWAVQTFSEQEINTLHSNAQKLTKVIEQFNFMECLTHPSLLVPHYCHLE